MNQTGRRARTRSKKRKGEGGKGGPGEKEEEWKEKNVKGEMSLTNNYIRSTQSKNRKNINLSSDKTGGVVVPQSSNKHIN